MRVHRSVPATFALLALVGGLTACSDDSAGSSGDTTVSTTSETAGAATTCVDSTATVDDPRAAEVVAAASAVRDDQSLGAVLLRVDQGGDEVVTAALGESLPDIPATADMHFWNGAMVFSYLGTVMLELQDEGLLDVDEPIARFLPDVPGADEITPRMLVTSTSGYVDYVTDEQWLTTFDADPFRPFTEDELEAIVFAQPLLFEPGTNVSYSHLNFRLAGEVVAQAAGAPLDEVLRSRFVEPLGLGSTSIRAAADLPAPFLHTFSDERGLFEETTGWSPAWGVPEGAIMATTVCDAAIAAAAVGSGELLSEESLELLLDPGTIGLGERSDACPSCIPMTEQINFGFGTINAGEWILQTPLFTGIAGVQAYLPSEDLSIAIANTWTDGGDISLNGSVTILQEIAPILAPDADPPRLQS